MVPVYVVGLRLADRYVVEQCILHGRVGNWFRAHDEKHSVLLITWKLIAAADRAARFLSRAAHAQALKTPHAARVLHIGLLSDGDPYAVLDSTPSKPQPITEKLPLDVAADQALAVCEVVAEAHASGWIIEDLNTACLEAVPKDVAPAGLRLRIPSCPHSTWDSCPAPEQLSDAEQVDCRADIWALGAVCFHLFCRQDPFKRDKWAWRQSILNDAPLQPRTLRSDLPKEIEQIILRCLEKAPAARPQSVAEVAAVLFPFRSAGNKWAHPISSSGSASPKSPQTDWDRVIELGEGLHPAGAQHTFNLAAAYYIRGARRHASGDYGAALADFTRAQEIDPCHRHAQARSTALDALGETQKALDAMPVSSAPTPPADGLGWQIGGEREPTLARSDYLRGLFMHRLGDYAGAIEALTRAITRWLPRRDYGSKLVLAAAYAARSTSFHELGKYQEAIADCTEAMSLEPHSASHPLSRGVSHHALGQYVQAIADYKCAIEFEPGNGEAYYYRGLAYRGRKEERSAARDHAQATLLGFQPAPASTSGPPD